MFIKLNILVVDDKDNNRLEGNAVSFYDEDIDVYINDGRYTSIYNGKKFTNKNLPNEIDLLLLHNNSVSAYKKLKIIPRVAIKYTGGKPPYYEFSDEYWVRQRSIEIKTDTLTKDEASQITNWIKKNCSENYLPDLLKPPKTKDCLLALFIFCMGYLMAGVAAEKINDKEVEKLIDWKDKIKVDFPKIKSDWETVTNPQWWDDLGKINDLKEQIRREMEGNLDEDVEKLIDYIKGTNAIKDFGTVKIVFKKLKDQKWL